MASNNTKQPMKVNTAIEFAQALAELAPVDWNSQDEIKRRRDFYFELCKRVNIPPGVESFAQAYKITRTDLLSLLKSDITDKRFAILREGVAMIENVTMALGRKGDIAPIITIYDTANNFSYSRQGDVVIDKKHVETTPEPEQIAQKYAGLLAEPDS
jgi:hypothetical protein